MDQDTANEAAAGAPGVVTLGGRDYLAEPVSDRHFVTVRTWVRQKAKRNSISMLEALAALPPEQAQALAKLPPAVRADALKAIFPEKPADSVTVEAATDAVMSVEGCRFIAWLFLKPPLNPDLTREKLDVLITEDNYLDVFAQLDEATGLSKVLKPAEGEPSGNPSGPRS